MATLQGSFSLFGEGMLPCWRARAVLCPGSPLGGFPGLTTHTPVAVDSPLSLARECHWGLGSFLSGAHLIMCPLSLTVVEEKGVKMKLTVTDTPGFGDQINNQNWYG